MRESQTILQRLNGAPEPEEWINLEESERCELRDFLLDAYRSESVEIFVSSSRLLGRLARVDAVLLEEIQDGILDWEDHHRFRHAHTALMSYADPKEEFFVPVCRKGIGVNKVKEKLGKEPNADLLQKMTILQYFSGMVVKGWKAGRYLGKGGIAAVFSSMVWGLPDAVSNGFFTLEDLEKTVFSDSSKCLKAARSEPFWIVSLPGVLETMASTGIADAETVAGWTSTLLETAEQATIQSIHLKSWFNSVTRLMKSLLGPPGKNGKDVLSDAFRDKFFQRLGAGMNVSESGFLTAVIALPWKPEFEQKIRALCRIDDLDADMKDFVNSVIFWARFRESSVNLKNQLNMMENKLLKRSFFSTDYSVLPRRLQIMIIISATALINDFENRAQRKSKKVSVVNRRFPLFHQLFKLSSNNLDIQTFILRGIKDVILTADAHGKQDTRLLSPVWVMTLRTLKSSSLRSTMVKDLSTLCLYRLQAALNEDPDRFFNDVRTLLYLDPLTKIFKEMSSFSFDSKLKSKLEIMIEMLDVAETMAEDEEVALKYENDILTEQIKSLTNYFTEIGDTTGARLMDQFDLAASIDTEFAVNEDVLCRIIRPSLFCEMISSDDELLPTDEEVIQVMEQGLTRRSSILAHKAGDLMKRIRHLHYLLENANLSDFETAFDIAAELLENLRELEGMVIRYFPEIYREASAIQLDMVRERCDYKVNRLRDIQTTAEGGDENELFRIIMEDFPGEQPDEKEVRFLQEWSKKRFAWTMALEADRLLYRNKFRRFGFLQMGRWVRRRSDIILSAIVGYMVCFLVGGNSDIWSYYAAATWQSTLFLTVLVVVGGWLYINLVIKDRLSGETNRLFGNESYFRRWSRVWAVGNILALFLSLVGLTAYSLFDGEQVGLVNKGFVDQLTAFIEGTSRNPRAFLEVYLKYIITFPPASLLIGMVLEEKMS